MHHRLQTGSSSATGPLRDEASAKRSMPPPPLPPRGIPAGPHPPPTTNAAVLQSIGNIIHTNVGFQQVKGAQQATELVTCVFQPRIKTHKSGMRADLGNSVLPMSGTTILTGMRHGCCSLVDPLFM